MGLRKFLLFIVSAKQKVICRYNPDKTKRASARELRVEALDCRAQDLMTCPETARKTLCAEGRGIFALLRCEKGFAFFDADSQTITRTKNKNDHPEGRSNKTV